MKTATMSIDLLRLDADTQNRLAISETTVDEYAELISDNGEWPLGALDVFHDGTDYFVADGFHRTLAAIRANRASIPCRLHKGTAHDARIFGMTANDKHGLRMSREDKRACVEYLLDNEGRLTQAQISQTAGVSLRTVKRIVADRRSADETLSQRDDASSDQKGPMSPNSSGGGGGTAEVEKVPMAPSEKDQEQELWEVFAELHKDILWHLKQAKALLNKLEGHEEEAAYIHPVLTRIKADYQQLYRNINGTTPIGIRRGKIEVKMNRNR